MKTLQDAREEAIRIFLLRVAFDEYDAGHRGWLKQYQVLLDTYEADKTPANVAQLDICFDAACAWDKRATAKVLALL